MEVGSQEKDAQFSYHVLTKEHRDQVLVMAARAFCDEPITSGVTEKKPEMKPNFIDWVEFTDYWMDDASTNGHTVVVMDTVAHRVAGVAITIDASMTPDGYVAKYSDDSKAFTPLFSFLCDMKAGAEQEMPELAIPGTVGDLFMLGVHPDYVGRGFASKLFKKALSSLKQAGFKYATILATSAFTSKIASSLECDLVYQMKVKDWKWKGEPFYTNIKEPHGCCKFWVKELSSFS